MCRGKPLTRCDGHDIGTGNEGPEDYMVRQSPIVLADLEPL